MEFWWKKSISQLTHNH